MFERHYQPLLSLRKFYQRLIAHILVALALLALSLFFGMWGYRHFEGFSWIDSFADAAMILSGMGPLSPLKTDAGKLFAGCYAIYSGLLFILVLGIVLAPVVHRLFHTFHINDNLK